MIELWLRKYIFSVLIWAFFKSLSLTWRLTLEEPDAMKKSLADRDPLIFAHWHGDELALLDIIPRYRIATITSTSKDGELMNSVIRMLGGVTSRGSSTRGGVHALKGLIRLVKEQKRNSSFAVDGPKGPIFQVKPGVFELSRLMNAQIYVVGVGCSRAWIFDKSWNKTFLPKPFARVHMQWLGPFPAVTREQDPRSEDLQKLVADALHNARLVALKKIATPGSVS